MKRINLALIVLALSIVCLIAAIVHPEPHVRIFFGYASLFSAITAFSTVNQY